MIKFVKKELLRTDLFDKSVLDDGQEGDRGPLAVYPSATWVKARAVLAGMGTLQEEWQMTRSCAYKARSLRVPLESYIFFTKIS